MSQDIWIKTKSGYTMQTAEPMAIIPCVGPDDVVPVEWVDTNEHKCMATMKTVGNRGLRE